MDGGQQLHDVNAEPVGNTCQHHHRAVVPAALELLELLHLHPEFFSRRRLGPVPRGPNTFEVGDQSSLEIEVRRRLVLVVAEVLAVLGH